MQRDCSCTEKSQAPQGSFSSNIQRLGLQAYVSLCAPAVATWPLFIFVACVWGKAQYLLDIVVYTSIIHVFSQASISWESHLVFNQYWVYPSLAIVKEPAFHLSAGTLQSHNGGRNSAEIKQCWELVRNVNDIAPIVSDVSSIVLTVVSQLKKCWEACMMKSEPVYCNMLCQEQLPDLMLQVAYFCGKENWVLKPSVHSAAKLQPQSFLWLCQYHREGWKWIYPNQGEEGGSCWPVLEVKLEGPHKVCSRRGRIALQGKEKEQEFRWEPSKEKL